jgi:hypothetical protein
MNRNIVIGVVIVILLVLGLWWYLSSTSMSSSTSETNNNAATSSENSSSGTTGTTAGSKSTLGAVLAHGGNYTCTISSTSSTGNATGVIYAAGSKTRVDFNATSQDGTSVQTHVIRDGTWSYTWVDGMTTGTKTAMTTSAPRNPQPSGGVISEDSSVSSDCHPWVPDATQFVPPKGITFRTI